MEDIAKALGSCTLNDVWLGASILERLFLSPKIRYVPSCFKISKVRGFVNFSVRYSLFTTKSNKSVINSVKLIKDAAGYNLRVLDVNCCYIRIVGKDGL